MITIGIKHNLQETVRFLDQKFAKQVPFATAVALTKTAQLGQKAVVKKIDSRLDKPKPYTQKSVRVQRATKRRLQARVYIRDRSTARNPRSAAEIIGQQFGGGGRLKKPVEKFLEQAGYITASEFVAPGGAAQLDAYGNIRRRQVKDLITQLKQGKSADQKSRRGGQYFWSTGERLPRGVWLKTSNRVRPILIVINRPSYKARVDLVRVVDAVVVRHFDVEFRKALEYAIRTAR